MRKLILKMSMSLDGFVGGPNGESDWIFRTSDDESIAWGLVTVRQVGLHAMGRKTFRDMAAYWPTSTEAFAPPMNEIPKVVFTRAGLDAKGSTATTPRLKDAPPQATKKDADPDVMRSWTHPRVATGDLATEIARLKQEPGKDIIAYGGASFAQSLVQLDVIDEYHFLVHPVVLGRGLPVFTNIERPLDLELAELKRFPKGAVGHIYIPKRG